MKVEVGRRVRRTAMATATPSCAGSVWLHATQARNGGGVMLEKIASTERGRGANPPEYAPESERPGAAATAEAWRRAPGAPHAPGKNGPRAA